MRIVQIFHYESRTSRHNEATGQWEIVPQDYLAVDMEDGSYGSVLAEREGHKTFGNTRYLPTEWEAIKFAEYMSKGASDIGAMMRLLEERVALQRANFRSIPDPSCCCRKLGAGDCCEPCHRGNHNGCVGPL